MPAPSREPAHRVEEAGARRWPIAGCHERVGFRDAGAFVGWIERRGARGGVTSGSAAAAAETRQRLGYLACAEQTKPGRRPPARRAARLPTHRRADRRRTPKSSAAPAVAPVLTAVSNASSAAPRPRSSQPLGGAEIQIRAPMQAQLSRGRIRRHSRRGPVEPCVCEAAQRWAAAKDGSSATA